MKHWDTKTNTPRPDAFEMKFRADLGEIVANSIETVLLNLETTVERLPVSCHDREGLGHDSIETCPTIDRQDVLAEINRIIANLRSR